MKLRSYINITYGIAGIIVAVAMVAIFTLVSREALTIDGVARNRAIYHDLSNLNFLLLNDVPADPTSTIDLLSKHAANLRVEAQIDNDYVLTGHLFELAESADAWRELAARRATEAARARMIFQVRLHIHESLSAATNILTRAEYRLDEINRQLQFVAIGIMAGMLCLIVVVGSMLRRQVTGPLREFTQNLSAFSPEAGFPVPPKTRIREFQELHNAFEKLNRRLGAAFHEIEEREAKYSSLFYNSAHGVITLDATGRISAANTAAYEMLGCHEAELLGAGIGEYLTEDEPENTAISANSPVREATMRCFDGTAFPAEFTRNAFTTRREAQMSVLVFRDISDRKQAREERRRLEAQLLHAEKLNTVGTLAGGMAHDLNNILTPIINYADLLLDGDATKEEVATFAAEIVTAGHRAADLVKQILTFSRQTKPDARTTALAPLIEETLKLIRSTAPANIEIVTHIDEQSPPAFIDPTQIHQVLMNLCVNAVHAMGRTGGVLTVSLDTVPADTITARIQSKQHEGEYLRVSVTDTGHGIDEETRKRIFDPFFTTKELGEGTGLGLSTVHGIVMAHGGEITVPTGPGAGTAFHVFLPVREAVPSVLDVARAPVRGDGQHILVIDDERSITDVVGRMLRRMGYQTTLLNDGARALEVFTSSPDVFDMVITDHLMPRMTGITLAEKILEARANLPIILMTGLLDTKSTKMLKQVGIERFLLKPVTKDSLGNAVHLALESVAP